MSATLQLLGLATLAGAALAQAPAPVPDWAVGVLPSGDEFRLEIAATPEQQALGYMFRERVGPREGMLFLFAGPGQHSIWMKNCKVPLDLLWLDENWRVVYIAHEQQPCPAEGECPGVTPLGVSRYVLELAGGTARAQNLQPGDPIVVLSEPPLP